MKRGRIVSGSKDTLTGGTRDVNPQWMGITLTQTGNDVTTIGELVLPVAKLADPTNPTIIEVLKVLYDFTALVVPPAAFTNILIRASLSTSNPGVAAAVELENPRAFSWVQRETAAAFTAAGSLYDSRTDPITQDLTDGSGHGILVATDSIFLQIASASTGATNTVRVKILYRYKKVSIVEYVGIVQSQS